MRLESVYIIPCICGQTVESNSPTVICPKCGKSLTVENWGKPAASVTDAEYLKLKAAE